MVLIAVVIGMSCMSVGGGGGVHSLSCVLLFCNPVTVPHQAPLSIGFSRQEYWSGLPIPPPGNLPNPEIKPTPLALAGAFFTTELPGKPQYLAYPVYNFNVHIFHFYKFYLVLLKIC